MAVHSPTAPRRAVGRRPEGDRVLVHRQPKDDGYRDVGTVGRGEEASPLAFPELRLRVDQILG